MASGTALAETRGKLCGDKSGFFWWSSFLRLLTQPRVALHHVHSDQCNSRFSLYFFQEIYPTRAVVAADATNAAMADEEEISIYDEIEIEDMTWDEALQIFHYPCPCGDRFEIVIDDLRDESNDVATCPSCSLMIRVIYDAVGSTSRRNLASIALGALC